MIDYRPFIKRDTEIRFGKPCIIDTRIIVFDVPGWLAAGIDFNDIVTDFPESTIQDIKACLAYAADMEHKLKLVS